MRRDALVDFSGRLGEMLVEDGVIKRAQLDQALRAQVMWGARLGTNLVDLGHVKLDTLANALARQHRMPPALEHHFERADSELQRRFPVEMAERLTCLPLLRLGAAKDRVAIATLGPLDGWVLESIADQLAIDVRHLVTSVASELRIRYHLERVYGIVRSARFLRSRGKTVAPFADFEIDLDVNDTEPPVKPAVVAVATPVPAVPVTPPPVAATSPRPAEPPFALPESDFARVSPPIVPAKQDRRRYVQTLADALGPDESAAATAIGKVSITFVASRAAPPPLADTLRAFRSAGDRERVADLALEALSGHGGGEAAVVLVVRGDAAIGWRGFRRAPNLHEVAVPLDQPGLVPQAIERKLTQRARAGELTLIDRRLAATLSSRGAAELVVVPVVFAGQIMCVFAIASDGRVDVASIEAIAKAAGTALARLIRDANR